MSNNLESLRSRIMENINSKKDGEKKVPTGPRGSMETVERQPAKGENISEIVRHESNGGTYLEVDPRRGNSRMDLRVGGGAANGGRRNAQQTASNSVPLGAPSRFGSQGAGYFNNLESRRNISIQPDDMPRSEALQYDSRRSNNRFGSRYASRFEGSARGRRQQPTNGGRSFNSNGPRYQGNDGGARIQSRNMPRNSWSGTNSSYVRDWSPDDRNIDWTKIVSIDERVRSRPSRWDITPKGFDKVPAERAKLSGLFPLPGQPQELDRATLEGIVEKGALNRRTKILFEDPTKQNLVQCKLNRTIIITSTVLEFSEQELVAKVIANFLTRVTLEGKHEVVLWRAQSNRLILELSTEETTTVVLSSQKYLEKELDQKFIWQRPGEYVCREDIQEPICAHNLIVIPEIAVEEISAVPEWLQQQGIKYTWLHCLELAPENANADDKIFTKVVLYNPANDGQSSNSVPGSDILKPNETQLIQNFSNISYQTFSKIVAVQTHKPSKVVCLLNAVDPVDLKNEKCYQEIYEAMMFGSPVVNCGAVESIKIPVPSADFRNNFDSVPLQIGKIFIKFKEMDGAERAMLTLAGMRFGERTILCSYFSERDFDLGLF
ncbi:Mud2p Ecym_3429 [Eremothecium cymbalariae DBVPG|uniref:RRM domain-containing protein n=1 Tax=Eremothecium cymbalariae (strain CBS 270.75 / DBVPG 7215 / KCTC 17166 / NRRL Y-17582) TaxID=931890 RepID=G8JRZ6_ERECY|nr:Hypothetical protein Ecym_3429 [Eremothecium cymbalariae DBVPG\